MRTPVRGPIDMVLLAAGALVAGGARFRRTGGGCECGAQWQPTLAASIPCTLILARFAPSFPLGGVIANLVAVPVGECAALPLCLVHALLAWWPAAERGCAVAASGALVMIRAVARGFSVAALTTNVPQPTSWQLAVLVAIGLGGRAKGAQASRHDGLRRRRNSPSRALRPSLGRSTGRPPRHFP